MNPTMFNDLMLTSFLVRTVHPIPSSQPAFSHIKLVYRPYARLISVEGAIVYSVKTDISQFKTDISQFKTDISQF
jgi:hypothetical protein